MNKSGVFITKLVLTMHIPKVDSYSATLELETTITQTSCLFIEIFISQCATLEYKLIIKNGYILAFYPYFSCIFTYVFAK